MNTTGTDDERTLAQELGCGKEAGDAYAAESSSEDAESSTGRDAIPASGLPTPKQKLTSGVPGWSAHQSPEDSVLATTRSDSFDREPGSVDSDRVPIHPVHETVFDNLHCVKPERLCRLRRRCRCRRHHR